MDFQKKKDTFINDKLIGRTIEITQEDIDCGRVKQRNLCALALGVKRELKAEVSVDSTGIWLRYHLPGKEDMIISILTSRKICDWIKSFDKDDNVKPITIKIHEVENAIVVHNGIVIYHGRDLEAGILE